MRKMLFTATLLASGAVATAPMAETDKVFVGQLADFSGATAFVGHPYGGGVRDALRYIQKTGGISGTPLEFETVDYAYKVPSAIANYKKWKDRNDMVALQGWGTADTEALISFVARDEIPVYSASYSGHLTDPTGKNPRTKKPAPYNYFYGASYSDGCRALVQWAAEDHKAKGTAGAPKFVHVGDNHPYPNAPKVACGEYAAELGFEVLNPVVVSMKPGDFKAQCLTIKESGADYAFVANLGPSVVSLIKSCGTVGTDVQFISNIWGGDLQTVESIGAGADGYVFPAMTSFWTDDTPGMDLVRKISANADPDATYRNHHYIRGICSVYYMKEAMEWAKANGGITGANIKQGMYATKDWVPAGLEGVCIPSTWTAEDHRGTMRVNVYRSTVKDGKIDIDMVKQVELPRREDWLGY